MTVRAKLGLISGSRDNPTQSVTVFDNTDAALDYDVALEAAKDAVPASLFSALPDLASIQVDERKASSIRFSIGYTRRGQNILLRSVNAQTKAKKLYHFLSAGSVYGEGGTDITSDHSKNKWKLDRQSNPTEFNSGKPLPIDPLSATRTLTYKTRRTFVTDSYLDAVEHMVAQGVFNSSSFLGRSPKTMQLLSFGVNEREDGDWEISYGFGYQPAQINVDVGDGVQIPTLYANQSYWPIEKGVYADTNMQPKVVGVVVGDVWPTVDFAGLKLPWQGSLTTRTSASSGIITTIYTHDITAGTVYIFWNGGYMQATATAVGSFTVEFFSGVGDYLPYAATNLCVTKYTA
jgi:hypothetical protein